MSYDADELHALAELGYALAQEGRHGEARIVWEGLALVNPSDEAPLRLLALLARREQRHTDAVTLASAALERGAGPALALLRAEAFLQVGRYGEALADLEWLLRERPGDESFLPVRRRALALRARLRR